MHLDKRQRNRKISFYLHGKTILLGNGLSRTFNSSPSWSELLGVNDKRIEKLPYPLKLRLIDIKIEQVLFKLEKHLTPTEEYASIIKRLVRNGFVNFLTTNYTYEIEYSLLPLNKRNYDYIKKCSFSMKNTFLDKGVSISNYTIIKYEGKSIYIWHLHGEIRKKSSIVLDQNTYGKLVGDIYNYDVKNIFKVNHYGYDYQGYACKSWIELFLLDDLYIVGYGLDYSEFDIWWILEKRKIYRLKLSNKIFLYQTYAKEFNNITKKLFKKEDIKLINCNRNCKEYDFKKLYTNIIDNIVRNS